MTKGGLLTLWFTFEELISIIVVQRLIEVYTERDDDKMKMEMSVKERELFEVLTTLLGYSEDSACSYLKMDKLIPVGEDGTVDGKELHEALEVKTPFKKWIDRMIAHGFIEGFDYKVWLKSPLIESSEDKAVHARFTREEMESMTPQQRSAYGITTEYTLTTMMADHISMLQDNKVGMEVRNYFIMNRNVARKLLEEEVEIRKRMSKNAIKRAQAATKARNEAWEVQGTRREIIDEYSKLVSMLGYDSLPREVKAQLAKIDMLRELTGNNWTTH